MRHGMKLVTGRHAEAADEVQQFLGVHGKRFRRSRGFFRHGRIVLGGDVELVER